MLIIDGQFDPNLQVTAKGDATASHKETYLVLIGPILKNREFVRAIATASLAETYFDTPGGAPAQPVALGASWRILGVDADWDDESGRVELRIETEVRSKGGGQTASVSSIAFHVTILAAIPAF